jgi:hypothetical protein
VNARHTFPTPQTDARKVYGLDEDPLEGDEDLLPIAKMRPELNDWMRKYGGGA